jgi:magnesium-transporting ATPase (P-type)
MREISLSFRSQTLIDQNSKDDFQQAFSSLHYLFAQIFLKSLILICIPFSLLSPRRVHPKPLDDSTKKHLAREEIWKVMLRFTFIHLVSMVLF